MPQNQRKTFWLPLVWGFWVKICFITAYQSSCISYARDSIETPWMYLFLKWNQETDKYTKRKGESDLESILPSAWCCERDYHPSDMQEQTSRLQNFADGNTRKSLLCSFHFWYSGLPYIIFFHHLLHFIVHCKCKILILLSIIIGIPLVKDPPL